MSEAVAPVYSGIDNLELMEEARRYNAFLRHTVESVIRPGDRVLDFGAGTGVLARPLSASACRLSCVEPDPELRARLCALGIAAEPTLDAIPYESIDTIYTVNVLEHIEDDAGAVAALTQRLRRGGRLLVYVPAFPALYSSMDRNVGHVRRYRRGELTRLLRNAGLATERVSYCDCLGFLASLIFKQIVSDDGTINRSALLAYDRYVFPLSRMLDRIADRYFGKNLLAIARRD
jgi:SAM-dependent methyltransferase